MVRFNRGEAFRGNPGCHSSSTGGSKVDRQTENDGRILRHISPRSQFSLYSISNFLVSKLQVFWTTQVGKRKGHGHLTNGPALNKQEEKEDRREPGFTRCNFGVLLEMLISAIVTLNLNLSSPPNLKNCSQFPLESIAVQPYNEVDPMFIREVGIRKLNPSAQFLGCTDINIRLGEGGARRYPTRDTPPVVCLCLVLSQAVNQSFSPEKLLTS